MRIVNLILALLFVLFASFQGNDEDGAIWIVLYGAVALLLGFAAFKRYLRWATWGIAAAILVGMIYYAPGLWEFFTNDDGITFSQGMSNEFSYIEEAREVGGLTIALAAVGWVLWQQGRHHTTSV